jgi:hypothetical protein
VAATSEWFSKGLPVGEMAVLYLAENVSSGGEANFLVVGSDYGVLVVDDRTATSQAPAAPLREMRVSLDDPDALGLAVIGTNDPKLGHDFTTPPDPPEPFASQMPDSPTVLKIEPVEGHTDGSTVRFWTSVLSPDTGFTIGLCASDVTKRGVRRCDANTRIHLTSDSEGNLSGEIVVVRHLQLSDGEELDCTTRRSCRLALARTDDLHRDFRTAPLQVIPS